MKKTFVLVLFVSLACASFGREYHVTTTGNDAADGKMESPLRTINRAAQLAQPGDTVTVHEGTYREWVNPLNGGWDSDRRILYRAAKGETVELKGSEIVKDWKKEKDGVWKAVLPNSFFGESNPFLTEIVGDWFNGKKRTHHTAEVYLNDVSLYETISRESVAKDTIRSRRDPDGSRLLWYAEVDGENTTIYARFDEADPRKELVEVAVRPTCFYPTREGINYLTIRGFHISQAATQWAAPTAEQIGMVATHWCKGWIIEDNVIRNSRCNGISLGKQCSTGHNLWTQRKFDGATEYIEVTLSAVRKGWNKDNVGSHIVRRNDISFCEQTGICGSMGASFSEIYDNHIHDTWVKQQFDGAEISGIKLHAAIDAYIHNNWIHHSQKGIWMDWMAQGSRISCNLMNDNVTMDIFYEVDHGPFTCDNNMMLSACSLWDWSNGGAFLHNLFGGTIVARNGGRSTPYQLIHSTEVKGLYGTGNGDNRFMNNIFCIYEGENYGLATYKGKKAWDNLEEDNTECQKPRIELETGEDGKAYLTFVPSETIAKGKMVDASRLGIVRLSNYPYENADGTPIRIDKDFLGQERPEESTYVGPFEKPTIQKVRVW